MSETAAEIAQQTNVNLYLNLVSFTMLYYDYFLTLPDEISRFWAHRQFSWAAFFFYLNRYFAFFGTIPVIVEYFLATPLTPAKFLICDKLQSYHQYFAILAQVIVAVMLIMRTYALYEFKKWILILMLTVTAAVLGFGLWTFLGGTKDTTFVTEELPFIGCPAALSKDQSIRIGAGWAGMLVFDLMIFGLTFARALLLRSRTSDGLLTLLVRDGAIYFAVMIASNLANILTFMFGGTRIRGVATTFTNVISTIMITRLMLNLRDPHLLEGKRSRFTTTASSSRQISTLVGPTQFTAITSRTTTGWDQNCTIDDRDLRDSRDGGTDIELVPFARRP